MPKNYAAPDTRLLLVGRNQERLQHVAEHCQQQGAQVELGIFDVRNDSDYCDWLREKDKEQPIDLIIANAGLSISQAQREGSAALYEAEHTMVDIHLKGMLNTVHPFIRAFKHRKRGQIAIMCSMNAFVPLARSNMYGAVKAAMLHYSRALRVELKSHHIKVSAICPGWVESRLTEKNTFPMPWLMSGERAARIIRKGLENNKAVIAFPWQLVGVVKLFKLLPIWLQEKFQ